MYVCMAHKHFPYSPYVLRFNCDFFLLNENALEETKANHFVLSGVTPHISGTIQSLRFP